MALPRSFTTVTPLSKFLAMTIFIVFPFVGFYLGYHYAVKSCIPPIAKTKLISPTPAQKITITKNPGWQTHIK